jgi:hypothetical protein
MYSQAIYLKEQSQPSSSWNSSFSLRMGFTYQLKTPKKRWYQPSIQRKFMFRLRRTYLPTIAIPWDQPLIQWRLMLYFQRDSLTSCISCGRYKAKGKLSIPLPVMLCVRRFTYILRHMSVINSTNPSPSIWRYALTSISIRNSTKSSSICNWQDEDFEQVL